MYAKIAWRAASRVGGLQNQLRLEGGEETLGDRVVPTIPLVTHARDDAVRREQLPVFATRVQSDAGARGGPPVGQRHAQRRQREVRVQRHRPPTRREARSRTIARNSQATRFVATGSPWPAARRRRAAPHRCGGSAYAPRAA